MTTKSTNRKQDNLNKTRKYTPFQNIGDNSKYSKKHKETINNTKEGIYTPIKPKSEKTEETIKQKKKLDEMKKSNFTKEKSDSNTKKLNLSHGARPEPPRPPSKFLNAGSENKVSKKNNKNEKTNILKNKSKEGDNNLKVDHKESIQKYRNNISKIEIKAKAKELVKDDKNKGLQLNDQKPKYDKYSTIKNKKDSEKQELENKLKLLSESYDKLLESNKKNKEEIKSLKEINNKIKTKYSEEVSNKTEIIKEKELLKKELNNIKKNNNELLEKKEKNSNHNIIKINNIIENRKPRCEYKYDISIKIESLNQLLNGWDVKYNDKAKYLTYKDKKLLLVGLIGLKNSGKTFILSRLLNENIYDNEDKDCLYVKYIKQKNCEYTIIDTPGLGRALKNNDNNILNEKEIQGLEKYNIQTDNFLINFILKRCNCIICIIGYLNFNEQKLLNKLKMKDIEYKKEYNKIKKLFIIHNLKELSTKKEVSEYINNKLLKSGTFKLIEKKSQYANSNLNSHNNVKYYIEKNIDDELEIYHLIIAKEDTEAGDYYNEFTYNMIVDRFNSFHYFNSSDIINEIKDEIKSISKNIFIKPITSLNDFEYSDNKIKLKNSFEFLNNSEGNTDFSYLSLRPKYSYYKINNQLLILIEMPGNIVNKKFIVNKPKDGYYLMKFSGEKKMELPNNLEDQKKNNCFYSNIDVGEFEETIRISVANYQIKSYNYKCEEEKGIYKYYFDIVDEEEDIDEDEL